MYIYLKSMRLWGQDTLFSLFTECSEHRASMVAQTVNNLSVNARDVSSIPGLGRFPGEGHGNALQSSCLEIPRTEEPGGLQSTDRKEPHMTDSTQISPQNTETAKPPWDRLQDPGCSAAFGWETETEFSSWVSPTWIMCVITHPSQQKGKCHSQLTSIWLTSILHLQSPYLQLLGFPHSCSEKRPTVCAGGQGVDLELLENYSIPKKRERRIWVNQ